MKGFLTPVEKELRSDLIKQKYALKEEVQLCCRDEQYGEVQAGWSDNWSLSSEQSIHQDR